MYNPRGHEEFQFTNIFPFTKLHPRHYTRFFHNFCSSNFSTIIMVRFVWFFLLYHTLLNTHINTTIPVPSFKSLAPPPSLSHSPDLGRVAARRTTFLERFLGQLPHLPLGMPRPARIWLILDLVRTGRSDSENQDTLDNGL